MDLQLENWASNSSEGKYRLELSVPAELEAGKCLYTASSAKVQQQLSDLELVWDDQEDKLKQQQLL
eukprot:gene14542-14670_t